MLLRAGRGSPDEAIYVLDRARARIEKHRVVTHTMPIIGADLAMDSVRKGHEDEAIAELRDLFSIHMDSGHRLEVVCTGEALVTLLVRRGARDDLTEAHRIVDDWEARRPDIPAADLWWLKSRAVLAKAEGDLDGYAELATEYLELCEKLDARGRLAEARCMVGIRRLT
jgi:adenylate cyclase